MTERYDLDGLRAAWEGSTYDEWAVGYVSPEKVRDALINAARATPSLLDDAALGRAVRAAAERDGPEREAMANAIYFADRMGHEARERAAEGARALVAMGGK